MGVRVSVRVMFTEYETLSWEARSHSIGEFIISDIKSRATYLFYKTVIMQLQWMCWMKNRKKMRHNESRLASFNAQTNHIHLL